MLKHNSCNSAFGPGVHQNHMTDPPSYVRSRVGLILETEAFVAMVTVVSPLISAADGDG